MGSQVARMDVRAMGEVEAAVSPAMDRDEATPTITITGRAAKVMREQLQRRGTPGAKIRFGIRGGGCTGFSYLFEFEDGEPRASDLVVVKDGVTVLVDPKSLRVIAGTEIDFETGIRGHGFRFNNPQVSDSCGCGESITF